MSGTLEIVRVALVLLFAAASLFFTFVSMMGVIRLPDIYARAHTASQADTLGAGFALAAVAVTLGWEAGAFKTVLLLFFIFVTNPTAAHAIARAALEDGVVPWIEPGADTSGPVDHDAAGGDPDVAADGGDATPDTASDGGDAEFTAASDGGEER